MGFLAGKRVLIVGVASKLSIASGIAAAMHREGAELAFTYQNEKLKGRVEEFAAGWGSGPELCFPCDVASDEEIAKVFARPWITSKRSTAFISACLRDRPWALWEKADQGNQHWA